jgi:DNA-binding XRE family transcriptional regulator
MNERNAMDCKDAGRPAEKPAYANSFWRPGTDPNYSSHRGDYHWSDTKTSSGSLGPTMSGGDLAWSQAWHGEQAAQLKAELRGRLFAMTSGQRIRNLRGLFGWTQRQAAGELGISVRTLIRHEQSQRRTPSLRLPLLLRLRELESDHADELIAYISRAGRERT